MSGGLKRAVLVGLMFAAPQVGLAQDREFPVLNSIGRYLGIGYTCGGYHAPRDGRLDIITVRHPASAYRSGELPRSGLPYLDGPVMHAAAPSPEVIDAPRPVAPAAMAPARNSQPAAEPDPAVSNSRSSGWFGAPAYPALQSAAGLGTAAAAPAASEPLQTTQQQQPELLISPKDRIEVRQLAPETSPSDGLFNDNRSQRLPAQGITYSIIERGRRAWRDMATMPAGIIDQQSSAQPSQPQQLPPGSYPPGSSPAAPVTNRYPSPTIPVY